MEDTKYPILNQLFPQNNNQREDAFSFIVAETVKYGLGVLSKSEIDLIFFSAIMKFSNIKDKSDYNLSRLLKITPSRVRNLKEKYSVKFQEIDEKEMINNFFEMCQHAKIDDTYIDIPVYDVAMKNLLENKLEGYNIVLHNQLNSKIFRLRADDLVIIYVSLISSYNETSIEETKKELISHIKKKKAEQKIIYKDIDGISNFNDFIEKLKSIKMGEVIHIISSFATIITTVSK